MVLPPPRSTLFPYTTLFRSGVSGTEKFAASQKTWVSSLQTTLQERLGFAADRTIVLSESGTGTALANRANVLSTLTTLKTDRKSTRLNSSHGYISYAVFCLK